MIYLFDYIDSIKNFSLEDTMRKTVTIGFVLALWVIASFSALNAQEKKEGEPAKETELVQPIKEEPKPAPKGKEALMIYSGEYFKVQLYGFVKADFLYNTANFTHTSAPLNIVDQYSYWYLFSIAEAGPFRPYFVFTYLKTASQRDGGFFGDLRTTRIGLKLTGPEALKAKTSAVIEGDFWGQMPNSGTANRQGMFRMRHAMIKLEWPSNTSIMVGQFWSVAMPVVTADMVAFIPFGSMGLIFMREPQITLAQKVDIQKVFSINIEASIARTQAGDDPGASAMYVLGGVLYNVPYLYPGDRNSQLDFAGAGEASKIPGFRGRVTIDLKPHDLFALKLGCSAHYQIERQALTFSNYYTAGLLSASQWILITQKTSRAVHSFSIGPFASVNIHFLTLLGAMYVGDNMDTFLLGMGRGVVESFANTKYYAVRTIGGWAQAQFDLRKLGPIPLKLCAGFGTEVKPDNKLYTPGTQLYVRTYEGNLWWYLNDYLSLGAEVQHIAGKYKGAPLSKGMKYQMAMNFVF